jgi:hypothetical protein
MVMAATMAGTGTVMAATGVVMVIGTGTAVTGTMAAGITAAGIMAAGIAAADIMAGMVQGGDGMALGGDGATADACGLAAWSFAGKRFLRSHAFSSSDTATLKESPLLPSSRPTTVQRAAERRLVIVGWASLSGCLEAFQQCCCWLNEA